jgi:predicted O-methyltransferase YrrM
MTTQFFHGKDREGLDKRWIDVDQWTFTQTHTSKSIPSQEHLDAALKHQQESGLPDIAVSPSQGKFLLLQAKLIDAKNILEIGTLGGYSTMFLANASAETKVTTVEVSEKHAKVARENLDAAGVGEKVEILLGAGVDVLPGLLKDVKSGKRKPWDLVFIDADKVSNWDYFDMAANMSRPGALIIVDNVVRRGNLVDEEYTKNDQNVIGSRKVITNAGQDDRVESVVIQMVGDKNYDGFMFSVLKR